MNTTPKPKWAEEASVKDMPDMTMDSASKQPKESANSMTDEALKFLIEAVQNGWVSTTYATEACRSAKINLDENDWRNVKRNIKRGSTNLMNDATMRIPIYPKEASEFNPNDNRNFAGLPVHTISYTPTSGAVSDQCLWTVDPVKNQLVRVSPNTGTNMSFDTRLDPLDAILGKDDFNLRSWIGRPLKETKGWLDGPNDRLVEVNIPGTRSFVFMPLSRLRKHMIYRWPGDADTNGHHQMFQCLEDAARVMSGRMFGPPGSEVSFHIKHHPVDSTQLSHLPEVPENILYASDFSETVMMEQVQEAEPAMPKKHLIRLDDYQPDSLEHKLRGWWEGTHMDMPFFLRDIFTAYRTAMAEAFDVETMRERRALLQQHIAKCPMPDAFTIEANSCSIEEHASAVMLNIKSIDVDRKDHFYKVAVRMRGMEMQAWVQGETKTWTIGNPVILIIDADELKD